MISARIPLAILVTACVFISCNLPSGESSKSDAPYYPSRITKNGHIMTEYQYNADRTVKQINSYDTSGKVIVSSIYTYRDGLPVTDSLINYPNDTLNTYMFKNEFNSFGRASKQLQYRIHVGTVQGRQTYEYNNAHQNIKRTNYRGSDTTATYWFTYEYDGNDLVAMHLYAPNDSLVGTVNYARGAHPSVTFYLSTATTNPSPHNITAVSSSTPADSLGDIRFNIASVTYIFGAYSSAFTYDEQGRLLTELRTIPSKTPRTDSFGYEYLP